MEQERTKFALEVPYLGSLILTHSLNQQIPALKSFPPADRPNSTVVFWSFRIMVGLGLLMITQGILSLWLRYKKTVRLSTVPLVRLANGTVGLIAIWQGGLPPK